MSESIKKRCWAWTCPANIEPTEPPKPNAMPKKNC